MKAFLLRVVQNKSITKGLLIIIKGDRHLFHCETTEMPWKHNKINESCIPAGKYILEPRDNHIEIKNVPSRMYTAVRIGKFDEKMDGDLLVVDNQNFELLMKLIGKEPIMLRIYA